MENKLIGILAGMGPKSTAPFINLVVDECQTQYNAKYDIDFPHMLIYSLPTPFYIDKPIDHVLMKNTIITALRDLEKMGVKFIAMPCNSAHIYFEELKSSINIPLLNIVDEALSNLSTDVKRVTVFATPSTYESGIYQKKIELCNHELIYNNEWQLLLNKIIEEIKIKKDNKEAENLWKHLIDEVKGSSIDSIIVACTDLNVLLQKEILSVNVIDTAKSLAKAVVSRYLQL